MIADRLRKARIAAGMSRKALAKKANIPYTTYTNYETGYREPRSEALAQIADALGVDMAYFYTDDVVATIKNLRKALEATQTDSVLGVPLINNAKEVMVRGLEQKQGDRLNAAFNALNREGREKAIERVEELAEVPRYRKEQADASPKQEPTEGE